jgi:hypothetical protein
VSDDAETATRTISVKVNPSATGTPILSSDCDTGIDASDRITKATSLNFSGTSASGDTTSTVRVFVDINSNGSYDSASDHSVTATVNNGVWSVSNLDMSSAANGTYNVYAFITSAEGSLNSNLSSGLSIIYDSTAPTVTNVVVSTAGGDVLVNAAEKAAGFNVVARSNEANCTLYLVPTGTAGNIGTITTAAIKSIATGAAGVDVTMEISANNTSVIDGTSYRIYAVDSAGNISTISDISFTADTTAPTAPTVTSAAITNDTTPTWTWTAGTGGNGTYRYKLDSSDLSSEATETTTASYTPAMALSQGAHTLYVQERDAAGN